MTAAAIEPQVSGEEYSLRITDIDPDPDQPRLEVDEDLAASIEEHGILKAIEVRPHPVTAERWMIVDGERRWRGARKARLATIPAKVTFDVEGVNLASRMVRQIVHNTGKPLTPVEEAIAFKKILDARRADRLDEKGKVIEKGDTKYGPVALARELGLPKSTVTDRLATMEIPAFWLPLIVKGPLQPSHVPALHKWRKLPEKFQLRGLEKMKSDWKWPGTQRFGSRGAVAGDRLYIGDFENMLDAAMRSYVKPMGEVPGYKGPTERMMDTRGYPRATKTFAMDPSIWQPIARKKALERRKKNAGKSTARDSHQAQQPRWAEEDRKRRETQERRDRQWKAAYGKLNAAFVDAITAAKHSELQDFLLQRLRSRFRHAPKTTALAVGNNADQLLRHVALLLVLDAMSERYSRDTETAKLGKRFKVDVAKILKGAAKDDETPDPATTDPGEAGDGFLVAADEDEDDG